MPGDPTYGNTAGQVGGGTVEGTVSDLPTNQAVSFRPNSSLDPGTKYEITVTVEREGRRRSFDVTLGPR